MSILASMRHQTPSHLRAVPDVVGVYGGTFDNPNRFERLARNSKHIFLSVAQKKSGTVIPAGINAFQEHTTSNDGR
jgi:hypothetical protein